MNRKKSIINSTFFLVLLIFPFMSTSLQIFDSRVYQITLFWKSISFIIIVTQYLLFILKKKSINKCSMCSILLMLIYLLFTIIQNGSIPKYLGYMLTCIGMLFLIERYSFINKMNLIKSFLIEFRIIVYLNFIFMIIYPDGIYVSTMDYSSLAVRYNFIGMDNQTSPYFIVLMALTFYYAYLSKNKLTTMNKIDIFVSIVSIIYFWSATAVVGLAMFLMFMWLHVYNPKLANIKTGYKMVSILFIVIIIFNGQKIFSPFFEFVLNKDVTFSGRTQIWESAIAMISESPIIGKGIQESPNLVYFPRMLDFRTAHNEFLQIIIHGGLVSIGLLLYQLRLVQKRLYANWRNGSVVASLSSGIIAMLIMMLSESYGQMLCFYVLIFIAYYTLRVPNNN